MADATCSVEGCADRPKGHGLCDAHYKRWWRHGDPLSGTASKTPAGTPCTVDGCNKARHARELCPMHYQRWRTTGSLADPEPVDHESLFWAKVDVGHPLGCWEWTAATMNGYGAFGGPGRITRGAHRWAYLYLMGPIEHGLTLDHLCRNTLCVNPDHLEPVTRAENVLRGEGVGSRHYADRQEPTTVAL